MGPSGGYQYLPCGPFRGPLPCGPPARIWERLVNIAERNFQRPPCQRGLLVAVFSFMLVLHPKSKGGAGVEVGQESSTLLQTQTDKCE